MVARFGVTGDTACPSRNIGQNKKASPLKSFFPTVKPSPMQEQLVGLEADIVFCLPLSRSLRHLLDVLSPGEAAPVDAGIGAACPYGRSLKKMGVNSSGILSLGLNTATGLELSNSTESFHESTRTRLPRGKAAIWWTLSRSSLGALATKPLIQT